MSVKPEGDRPKCPQRSHAFSERVQQQEQHKAASCNSEPITGATDGCQAIVVTVRPTDPERKNNGDGEHLWNNVRPAMRGSATSIRCCGRGGARYCRARPRAGWRGRRPMVMG